MLISQGLGVWCATQRETYKYDKDVMPMERIDALDALGFVWNIWGQKRSKARVDAWDNMFRQLMEYKDVSIFSIALLDHTSLINNDLIAFYLPLGQWRLQYITIR